MRKFLWNDLKPMVISHLNHYFENNTDPILKEKKESINKSDNQDETVKKNFRCFRYKN